MTCSPKFRCTGEDLSFLVTFTVNDDLSVFSYVRTDIQKTGRSAYEDKVKDLLDHFKLNEKVKQRSVRRKTVDTSVQSRSVHLIILFLLLLI